MRASVVSVNIQSINALNSSRKGIMRKLVVKWVKYEDGVEWGKYEDGGEMGEI